MFQQEQGLELDCVYCNEIYQKLKGNCPVCQNSGPRFTPAQMMDTESSQRMLLDELSRLGEFETVHRDDDDREKALEYRRWLSGMIRQLCIYNVDLKEALKNRILDLDWHYKIDPEEGEYPK